MAPMSTTWRRPYTSIYDDNYRYGSSLYSGTLSDIEKKYTQSLSRTQMRSDRPDLTLSSFAGSSLSAAHAPGESSASNVPSSPRPPPPVPTSPVQDSITSPFRGSVFESRLSSALHSSYINTDDLFSKTTTASPEPRAKGKETPRPQSLYDDASVFTLPRLTSTTTKKEEPEPKKTAKKISREPQISRESSALPPFPTPTTENGPNSAFWKEKCRDLQTQVDFLTQAIADMGAKLKGELSTTKGKLHSELGDLHATVEQSSLQCNDLQKIIKRQTNQLMEYQSAYEDLQRQFQDALDELSGYQKRCQSIRREMDRLRGEVEETLQRKGASSRAQEVI